MHEAFVPEPFSLWIHHFCLLLFGAPVFIDHYSSLLFYCHPFVFVHVNFLLSFIAIFKVIRFYCARALSFFYSYINVLLFYSSSLLEPKVFFIDIVVVSYVDTGIHSMV